MITLKILIRRCRLVPNVQLRSDESELNFGRHVISRRFSVEQNFLTEKEEGGFVTSGTTEKCFVVNGKDAEASIILPEWWEFCRFL